MKYLITLLGAAFASVTTLFAAQQHFQLADGLEFAKPTTGLQLSEANFLPASSRAERNRRTRFLLYNEPQGDSIHYGLTAHCYTWTGFATLNSMATNVWIDDHDVWFGNLTPFSYIGDAYIHGQLDDDGLITILPQPVVTTDFNYLSEEHTFSIGKLLLSEPDADNKVSVLGIDPKGFQLQLNRKTGVITSVDHEAYIALYMSERDNATPDLTIDEKGQIAIDSYYYDPAFYPAGQLVTPPADAEPEPHSFAYINRSGNDKSELGAVWRDGQNVWIQGITCSSMKTSWVKGTVTDDVVSIPTRQNLGDEEASEDYQWLGYMGSFVRTFLSMELQGGNRLVEKPALTLTYTDYDGRYTLDGEQYVVTATPDFSYTNYVSGLIISPFTTIGVPVPVAPHEINLNDMTSKYEQEAKERGEVYTGGPVFQVVFYWDNKSVDGEYIDPSTLSYRVFLDDYLLEFQPEDYPASADAPGMTEPMTEIPWNYNISGIYYYELFGLMKAHILHFYDDLFNVLGIQGINTVDGERAYSDIARVDHDGHKLDPLPGEGIHALHAEQADVRYFDVQGRRVEAPMRGQFTLGRVTRADGSVRTLKVLVR